MKPTVKKPTQKENQEAQTWPIWEKEESAFPWEYDEQETCLPYNFVVLLLFGCSFSFLWFIWVLAFLIIPFLVWYLVVKYNAFTFDVVVILVILLQLL